MLNITICDGNSVQSEMIQAEIDRSLDSQISYNLQVFMMANFLSMRSLHETVPTILLFLILNLEILLNPALNLPERSTV